MIDWRMGMRLRHLASTGAVALALAAGPAARGQDFTDLVCVVPPHDRLCPVFPDDQTDFDRNFEYMVLVKGAQDPFDVFSWQAFVALNWPADGAGRPLKTGPRDRPDAPRVWQAFARRDAVMRRPDPACAAPGETGLAITDLVQADGSVLIDRAGNYAVFDTRLGGAAAGYIRDNGLDTAAGQRAHAGEISFPMGRLDAPGRAASVLLKTAWRVVGPGEAARHFTRPARIAVPAAHSETGAALCVETTLGLVGMHIVTRTASGNGNEWIWSTFEHMGNAPVAANARNVNSIYAQELFPGGCTAPDRAAAYAFFDPDCEDCPTNTPPAGNWRWAATPPHARIGGAPARPGRIVRCWEIFPSTAAVNALWQDRLRGTVWANYMLISTQWRGANKSPLFAHGEVPRFLTNTTLESYLQSDTRGTCLGCHAEAQTTDGRDANFTFVLGEAE